MIDDDKVRSMLRDALGVLCDIIEDENTPAAEVERRLAEMAEVAKLWRILGEVTEKPKAKK